jgi:(2Fe-2S) ferredoxin
MDPAPFKPRAQLYVCTNARVAGDPLQSACGLTGPEVYLAAKNAVGRAGRVGDVWVTRTACQGYCPPRGCSVALYPDGRRWINVTAADAAQVIAEALAAADGAE